MKMKRNYLIYLLALLTLSSCLSRKDSHPRPTRSTYQKPKPTRPQPSATASSNGARTSLSGWEYIEKYKDIAIAEMELYGIPASIKLAQAILESGSGNSELARVSNNHFGIKCASGWQGQRTYHRDDNPNDCFRVYDDPAHSFRDHSEFLLRPRYAKLFELDKNDFRGWARGLKAAGYATNPRYAELLVDLIERYGLDQYDRPESQREKDRREAIVKTEIEHAPIERELAAAKPPVAMVIHEVAAGETLYSIGKKYGMSGDELRAINGLKNESLAVGQLLMVSP